MVIYDASGHMSLHAMPHGRPHFSTDNWLEGTPEEIVAAYRGYHAYYGTYEIREDEGVVLHHIEGSLFPNWVNTTQRRTYELSGSKLTLITENGVRSQWERVV